MISGDVSKRYSIPIEHFDYGYIEKCTDVRELAKILRVLRSGDEGCYPDLERFCEKRIETLDPQNRILRKETHVRTKYDLAPEDWSQLQDDLSQWIVEMDMLSSPRDDGAHDGGADDREERETDEENLPPVRGTNVVVSASKAVKDGANADEQPKQLAPPTAIKPSKKTSGDNKAAGKKKKSNKRVMPRNYNEWDKINVEEELKKLDEEDLQKERHTENKEKGVQADAVQLNQSTSVELGEINRAALSADQLATRAIRDKEKGNEAFRAGDFDEALAYYNRSLSLHCTLPVINNRAFTYIKLEKWDNAIKDCNTVLGEDPKNVKALYRRAIAYKSRKQFAAAKKDLEKVLSIDSSHQKAVEMLESVKRSMENAKKQGNRLVIEEVSEEEESDADEKQAEETGKHEKKGTEAVVKGGQVETAKASKQKAETPRQKQDNASDDERSGAKVEEIWSNADVSLSDSPKPVVVDEPSVEKHVEKHQLSISEVVDRLTHSKEAASKLFSSGNFAQALSAYLQGIELVRASQFCDDQAGVAPAAACAQTNNLRYVFGLLLANAAACSLKLQRFDDCVRFCDESLVYVPAFAKSHLRRAAALEALGRFKDALDDYLRVLATDAASNAALDGKQRCQAALLAQENDLGTRVAVVEDDDDDDDDEEEERKDKMKKTRLEKTEKIVLEVPKLSVGAGAYEVAQAWNYLAKAVDGSKNDGGRMNCSAKSDETTEEEEEEEESDDDCIERHRILWTFLKDIPPAQFVKAISSQLDGTCLSKVVDSLFVAISEGTGDNAVVAAAFLLEVSTIARFSVVAMFLSPAQLSRLARVLQSLASSNNKVASNTKATLRKKFANYYQAT